MSGHSGGSGGENGFDGEGFSNGNDQDTCLNLVVRTILNSPNPEILKDLKESDELSIVLEEEGKRLRVVAKLDQNNIAGSITIPSLSTLIACIQNGYEYIAIVLSINGGRCEIQIRPRSTL